MQLHAQMPATDVIHDYSHLLRSDDYLHYWLSRAVKIESAHSESAILLALSFHIAPQRAVYYQQPGSRSSLITSDAVLYRIRQRSECAP